MSDTIIRNPENTIAFQGIAGAHSDMACKQAHPYMDTLPCDSFEDAFDAVKSGKVALAFIPIENSHAGRVAEIHNMLPHSDLHIIGEYFHTVRHHLMAIKGTSLDNITHVYSHTQALMQCQKSCREHNIIQVPYPDTAGAAHHIADLNDPTKAALASNLAAELYQLDIVKEDMQDAANNRTLFITLSREPLDPEKIDAPTILTSIIFSTRNIPAGLYKSLGGFATNNVNLLKLESYIPDYAKGTAQFLITFEGHPQQENVRFALEELGFFTSDVQLLGVYPADEQRFAIRQ